jgi:hypothetical protein
MTSAFLKSALAAERRARRRDDIKVIAKDAGWSVADTRVAIDLATLHLEIEASALTPSELLCLRSIAFEERRRISIGQTRSVESKVVSYRARKSKGWCVATARKRLCEFVNNGTANGLSERALNFVWLSHNGYCSLTPAGWALVLAVEAPS